VAGRVRGAGDRLAPPRSRTFGTAATSARQRFPWLWGRESLLRFGLSVVLAVALWLYVTGKQNPNVVAYNQALPISTQNLGSLLTVDNLLPSVHVRIRIDNGNQLVTFGSFRVFVNLFRLSPGRYGAVPVRVDPDPGIHVVTVSPSTVPVIIEQKAQKVIPVKYRILQSQPEGFGYNSVQISPSTVTVSGPQSFVSQVDAAEVDVNLFGVTSTVSNSSAPLLVNSQGVGFPASDRLTVNPQLVNVTIPVKALNSYKTLPLLVPIVGKPKAGFGVAGLTVTPTDITAIGSPALLARATSASTTSVSVGGHKGGRFVVHVGIVLPRGVRSVTTRATVVIDLRPVDASTSIQVGVSTVGVPAGFIARTQPAYILATVVGPYSRVSSAARGMKAVIDLSGFGLGTYQLAPRITAPSGLTVETVNPALVSVTLQPAPTR
jgi:YbbR domain-containing protein